MANILVNGLKANAGGGKCILNNYLTLLQESETRHYFFVLTPDKNLYSKYACDFVEIVDINSWYKKNTSLPLLYYWVLPKLLKKLKIDIIFNFGDVIIPTKVPQIYMFDWPYAVYPESIVWTLMSYKDYFMRKFKMALIKKYIKYPVAVIAQTPTIERRLKKYYGISEVEVIPSAIPLENLNNCANYNFNLPDSKFKLIYPSSWAPHKNLGVLIDLAHKIKNSLLPYVIIVTIEAKNNKLAKDFLEIIKEKQLDSIIINLGRLDIEKISSLYNQSDALLMPTLLETYGLPYVEAMYHEKTIFTSDLDFARDVCGNAAFYFDPLDADSILETITKAYENTDNRMLKIKEGKANISKLLTWNQVFEKYQEILETNIINAEARE